MHLKEQVTLVRRKQGKAHVEEAHLDFLDSLNRLFHTLLLRSNAVRGSVHNSRAALAAAATAATKTATAVCLAAGWRLCWHGVDVHAVLHGSVDLLQVPLQLPHFLAPQGLQVLKGYRSSNLVHALVVQQPHQHEWVIGRGHGLLQLLQDAGVRAGMVAVVVVVVVVVMVVCLGAFAKAAGLAGGVAIAAAVGVRHAAAGAVAWAVAAAACAVAAAVVCVLGCIQACELLDQLLLVQQVPKQLLLEALTVHK